MSNQFTICEHGLRLHKCETCQFRDERDDALARIAELEAENKLLTETGQLYVLADIREIVDPMSPGRMMQKELVERIREIMAENARLKVIETAIKNVMRLRMVQLPRGPHCSAECLGTCEHCLALHELKTALAAKEQA